MRRSVHDSLCRVVHLGPAAFSSTAGLCAHLHLHARKEIQRSVKQLPSLQSNAMGRNTHKKAFAHHTIGVHYKHVVALRTRASCRPQCGCRYYNDRVALGVKYPSHYFLVECAEIWISTHVTHVTQ
jgi:hypothetical protein